jgi:diguanylate cyclase (GGDEF)-like protein
MLLVRNPAVLFVSAYIVIFYAWVFIFRENEWMRFLGANILPITGGTISFIWLFQSYRVIKNRQRYFWLLLSVGVLFYLAANITWFYHQMILQVASPYPGWADLMWLIAYSFFLVALIYEMKVISRSVSLVPFIFNILIFMTIATTISVYYLVEQVLKQSDYSFVITFLTIAYPMYDLGFLFASISIYYLSQHSKQKKILLLISVGFLLQIVADSVYVYLSAAGEYSTGGFIDPLWQACLLLNGLAALYDQKNTKESYKNEKQWDIELTNNLKTLHNILPYLGVIFLLVLVIYNYYEYLNSLSIGLIVVLILIIVRQLAILKENIKLVRRYKSLAYRDTLTGLYNRSMFQEDSIRVIDKAKNNKSTAALFLIDLDRFKYINDTLGHYMGDHLLKEFSNRLQYCARDNSMIYRVGGDEFIIIVPDITYKDCIAIAETILKEMIPPFMIEGHEIVITLSIGISLFPENGDNYEDLLKYADSAMYLAKERGKNNYQFYNTVKS